MTTLSVVIPAYNEENGIADIMDRVLAVRPALADVNVSHLELLIVNDGSKDRTAEVAQEVANRESGVRVISHQTNKGYGAALKTGFAQASGELIGFLDADGTYPPEYFPVLCQKAMNGSDLVIGSRMAGADSEMPTTRRIGNIFFAGMISLLGGQRITDSASGMRVFKREVLQRVYPLPDGLNLTPIMSTRAIHERVQMTEVPIPYSERVGRSKLSVVRDGTRYVQSITWTVLTYNPVRILGAAGLAVIGIALLILLGLVIARFSGVTSLGPWGVVAVYTALIGAVTGISLFALGATFNYLVSLFYKEPVRQGLFGRPIFKQPLEQHFGWFGLLALALGFGLGIFSLILGLNGWEIARLWLYLLGAAMLTLVGVQLVFYWILMRILDELSKREALTTQDLNSH
ncbi:MAG: glycosyltransferase family 2 protein [Anaerolineales bacterium]|jgi:glycosyltransferase involved in cell wall biosynthesis